VAYTLTSGQVALRLAETGVCLSAATIQRYARSGRIPSKPTPGGRYRYDLAEVLRALADVSAERSLTRPTLLGGLGHGPAAADSPASTLSRAVTAHGSESLACRPTGDAAGDADAAGLPAALREQFRQSARCAVAMA
jgi:hypothetical protein